MGLGETIARTVLEFKVDHKQAKASITDLKSALSLVGEAAGYVSESLKTYGEHLELQAATTGVNVTKLQKSFDGLISQHDLLTLAARTQAGALKLNQSEMETLGKAAIAFKNRGFELTTAIEKLTDAAVKGKLGGLDDLGLSLKDGASRSETLRTLMSELNKVIDETGTSTSNAGDEVRRMSVAWDDAVESAKMYAAQATIAISEPLKIVQEQLDQIERTRAVLRGTALDLFGDGGVWGSFQHAAVQRFKMPTKDELLARARAENDVVEMPDDLDPSKDIKKRHEDAKRLADEYRKLADSLLGVESATERAIRVGEAQREGIQAEIELIAQLESDAALTPQRRYLLEMDQLNRLLNEGKISWEAWGLARKKAWEASGQSGLPGGAADLDAARQMVQQAKEETHRTLQEIEQDEIRKAREKIVKERTQSPLALMFGPIEEFDVYRESFVALGQTFTAFGSAVGASYEAIVTGQGSVSAAFKKVMADGLMAIGKSSVVEALRETALGFGKLALGPIGGVSAAMHFKAAALHGTVAVAAGLAANGLGTSAQVAASEKAAAEKAKEEEKAKKESAGGGSGGSDGPGKDTVIIAYLDPFAQQPEHIRRQQAREMVTNVMGNGVVENS